MFRAVFVSHEHGQGAAAGDRLSDNRDLSLFQKKYWPLLPLALVFTWTYDLFVLLLLATVFWVLVIAWAERRFEWRPLLWVILGCTAGLVINPYFPQNFQQQLLEHMTIKLTVRGFDVKVGSEWYPYDAWEFLGNSAVACRDACWLHRV